ncbi:MAG TPA: hypothetical protein VFW66_05640, partial [Gemmatimonadales bacterium]|nr:hypothetical protein [Gemmatimonadales bacterium]
MSFSIVAAALVLAAPSLRAQQATAQAPHTTSRVQHPTSPAAQRWWHTITVLAADSLHGRRIGTPGYLEAAHYVADQFAALGLAPAGTNGYFQPVQLAQVRVVPERSNVVLQTASGADTLPLRVRITPSSVADVAGPLVFVGYGLSLPGVHDDLAGVDLHGKVAVYLNRMPQGLSATLFAHGRASRWKTLEQRGAVAGIAIADPPRPNARRRGRRRGARPTTGLAADPAERGVLVTVEAKDAERLFAGSGHSYAELLKRSDAKQPLPTVALTPRLRVHLEIERTPITAPNVAGVLRGSDPAL